MPTLDESRIAFDARFRRVSGAADGERGVTRTEWRNGADGDDRNRLHG
jgi:hypothetical protein